MNDATGAAGLLLKLFELRTEPALRQSRAWFAFEFHPSTPQDVLRAWLGPGHESAPFRMVTSYWDMAAAFVTQGAIPATMFQRRQHGALRPLCQAPPISLGHPRGLQLSRLSPARAS
jgi:hypothetical protein